MKKSIFLRVNPHDHNYWLYPQTTVDIVAASFRFLTHIEWPRGYGDLTFNIQIAADQYIVNFEYNRDVTEIAKILPNENLYRLIILPHGNFHRWIESRRENVKHGRFRSLFDLRLKRIEGETRRI